jgi:hypothetical protein
MQDEILPNIGIPDSLGRNKFGQRQYLVVAVHQLVMAVHQQKTQIRSNLLTGYQQEIRDQNFNQRGEMSC